MAIQSMGPNPELLMDAGKEMAAEGEGRRFSCEGCGEGFRTEDELMVHENYHAAVEQPAWER